MLSYNCEENISIIKIWNFSQSLRPNMDLIDPRPLKKHIGSACLYVCTGHRDIVLKLHVSIPHVTRGPMVL